CTRPVTGRLGERRTPWPCSKPPQRRTQTERSSRIGRVARAARCRLRPARYNRPWPRPCSASIPVRRSKLRSRALISAMRCIGWATPHGPSSMPISSPASMAALRSTSPPALRSANDLRLLLELMAQADCLITHGGYLRAIAAGRLDDILQVGARAGSEDLARWRKASGLAPQPAVAIASASLDFPLPPSLAQHGQPVMVATGAGAPADKVAALRAHGCEVFVAGQGRYVEGRPLTRELGARGFRSLFLLAGPRMLETMLRDRILARLYLTMVHCVL